MRITTIPLKTKMPLIVMDTSFHFTECSSVINWGIANPPKDHPDQYVV